MMQVLGRSTKASQTEDWTHVVDCATLMERVEDELIPKLRTAQRPAEVHSASVNSALDVVELRISCYGQLSEVLCSKLSKVRTEWLSLLGPGSSVDLRVAVAVHRSARRL